MTLHLDNREYTMRIVIELDENAPNGDTFTPRNAAAAMKAINAAMELTSHPFSIRIEDWAQEDIDDTLDAYADGHTMAGSTLLTR